MGALYPNIAPYEHRALDRGDGNVIYWEVCGNPAGKPALVLHGGPGSGCASVFRTFFDPAAFHIVLFDQRGCGRSRPHASQADADFATNTTEHLLGDIEALRNHLNIECWLVYGGSWGATLALAYAESQPERVDALVLSSITMTRRAEVDWLYGHAGRLLPAAYAAFKAGVPEDVFGQGLCEAYWHRLIDPDPAVHHKAAEDWCRWEAALVEVDCRSKPSARWSNPDFRLAFARTVTHYFRHDAWMKDGDLLLHGGALAAIPGILIHARFDLAAPLKTAWELARAWPKSRLVLVEGAFHLATDTGMREAIVAATDEFAGRL